ncbi:MAG: hypothetical protein R2709_11805 [Marmoricola sp.]
MAYLQAATELFQMIASGPSSRRKDPISLDTPRAGDGFIQIDQRGEVTYASPNAQSVFRRLAWLRT